MAIKNVRNDPKSLSTLVSTGYCLLVEAIEIET